MKITFFVDDGYTGARTRPHTAEIPDDELSACLTEDDQINLINEIVQETFSARIFPYWDEGQMRNAPKPVEEQHEEKK